LKYNFHEPIRVKGSYGSVVEWWKFYKLIEKERNMARLLGDIPKQFIYEQAFTIVRRDGGLTGKNPVS